MQIAQPPIPRLSSAWDHRADDWAQYQEPQAAPLYRSILDSIPIHGRCRLLDLGCGTGLFCEMAAQIGVDPTGVDSSAARIAVAKQRRRGPRFVRADMLLLPFENATFHAVTAINSIPTAATLAPVLREARRLARPGGAIIVATFGRMSHCDLAAVLNVVSSMAGSPSEAPLYAGDGVLESAATEAGLSPVLVEDVECDWAWPEPTAALRALLSGGAAAEVMQRVGEQQVSDALLSALAPFRTSAGGYMLRNRYRYVIAVAPMTGPDAA
jgi:SAM-dependent methyltransferase